MIRVWGFLKGSSLKGFFTGSFLRGFRGSFTVNGFLKGSIGPCGSGFRFG